MKTIKPFIDAGFYTVPLFGELKRLPDGKKTNPKFEPKWKATYQKKFNTNATKIGGVLTGAVSNLIAIDCDDGNIYDLFRALDPTNKFVFVSKGKPAGGGTIMYRYPDDAGLESFSIQTTIAHLDFYANGGFVYLPSDSSDIKEPWPGDELPDLSEAPDTVIQLIRTLFEQCSLAKKTSTETIREPTKHAAYLAPQVELLAQRKECIPSLFKIITPKDFRGEDQYIRHGYLHPQNIPQGRGSEYLMKISAILGKDSSVDHDLYVRAMHVINSLWDDPMDSNKLNDTIVDPMVEGKSSIDNVPIWQFDEKWKEQGLAFTSKIGDAMEVFYDDIREAYHVLNYTTGTIKLFPKEGELFSYIEPVALAIPNRADVKMMVPVVRTTLRPDMPFGFFGSDTYNRQFNIFNPTPALLVLNDPTSYAGMYKRPNKTLEFIEVLIPDELTRTYVMSFLRSKFTTFMYSPVILYFLGKHGSGKDTFVNILSAIMGESYLARPSAKEFLEQYNGWMLDKFFVQLDEYGNQLHSMQDKEIALGKIKSYTGKPEMQIRQMRTDGFPYKHSTTFIMTANSNPLMVEDGDRRVHLISTPNVLKDHPAILKMGGTDKLMIAIREEVVDFAYYLATEVDSLSNQAYHTPPFSDAKHDMIAQMLNAGDKLAYFFKHGMLEQLEAIVEDYSCPEVLINAVEDRIMEEDLMNLYLQMTDHMGTKNGLAKSMRMYGIDKFPTTASGQKAWYYIVPGLGARKEQTVAVESINVVGVSDD